MAKKKPVKVVAQKTPPTSPLMRVAFLHSIGIIAYIAFVSFFMFFGEEFFGKEDTYLMPVVFLTLFTLSAAVVGSLMFGKPVMLYIDGKKREAVQLAGATIGFLAMEAIVLFVILTISQI